MSKLTDLRIKNAKPGDKRYHITDNGSGLFLIVQPSGHKSFVTFTRLKSGKQIKMTHGEAGVMTLADARVRNTEAIKDAKLGNDPRAPKREAKAKQLIAEGNTFEVFALKYLDSAKVKGRRTAYQIRGRLLTRAVPLLGDMPITSIKRSHVANAVDVITKQRGETQANRVLSDISCVLKFYGNRDDDYLMPRLADLKNTLKARSRVLSDDEIRKLWPVADRFTKFLLLSTCRRDEAASMQWKELDGQDWTLPAVRNQKTKQDLLRPLSPAAMALLGPRGAPDEYVFGTDPNKPLRSHARIKARADKASGVTGWRFHDLRRTARTLLSKAGVPADHAERCLGHSIGGIRGVYDRHEYHAEKKHAFEALARQIDLIVNPPAGNVTQLRPRKRASR
jgi:integrase